MSSTATATIRSGSDSHGKQTTTHPTLGKLFGSSDFSDCDFWRSMDLTKGKLFGSADSNSGFWNSRDLSVLFASGDSSSALTTSSNPNNCFRSIDHVPSLVSGSRSISESFVAKLMASRDSFFASIDPKDPIFMSIDPLPLRSIDLATAPPAKPPALFESVDWVGAYATTHKDIPYSGVEVFKSLEMPPLGIPPSAAEDSISKRCMDDYLRILKDPMGPSPTVAKKVGNKMGPSPTVAKRVEKKAEPCPVGPTTKTTTKKNKKVPSRCLEPKVKVYVEAMPDDILCGRGGKSNKHPGNEWYRQRIEEAKPIYDVSAKYEKTLLAQSIVKEMKEEGRRFIKFDNRKGKWYIVPDLAARRKAGQALREENTPEARLEKRQKYNK